MSSSREPRRPKPTKKIHKSHKENVAQQSVQQEQGLAASVPTPGCDATARLSQDYTEPQGEPLSNMTNLNTSAYAPDLPADTHVRLPADCEVWPTAIAGFRAQLQTIRTSIDASQSLESSSTGILARSEDLARLVNHVEVVDGSLRDLERFIIELTEPTGHAASHTPSGNADSFQRARHEHVADQWSDLSLGSDRWNDLSETIRVVDEDKFVPTVENLIGTVAGIAMQLDDRDDCDGARVFRELIPPLREVLIRSRRVLQREFTGVDVQTLPAPAKS